ncbi:MAG: hypothetical protein K8S87_05565 [Planctomycetes bacterium]|nr:hypothetical protein [Planctomycetota bacterium]
MKKSAIFFITAIFIFVLFGGLSSQDAEVKEKPEKKEQPQTKQSKSYDLTPKFTKDMKWKEIIKISMIQNSQRSSQTMNIDATSNAKITEMKDNKPSKIKFSDFMGTMKNESVYEGEEPYEDTDELKNITLKFGLTDDYQLTLDEKPDYKVREILFFYPAGNILGFMPPKKAVKVGDSWDTDILIPFNVKLIESEEIGSLNFSNMKSKFKLDKVETTKKFEIAYINWEGKCDLSPEKMSDEILSITWERTIIFDLTYNRVISTEGTMSVSMDDNDAGEFTFTRTLKYAKPATTENVKPKIQPKDDDEDE